MKTLFWRIVRWVFADSARQEEKGGFANKMLCEAEACTGRNPQQAQEMREAARAYLRMVS